ncbi:hypothetical protein [Microbacterium sp. SA39]|uniref:hypothetical protein n=1 Tax=Microbacterium sp. SA39 TaxID=1263625 RepID=UPI00126A7ACC|nr:hypothetical protein [Microbacterium sp. SA39]
MGAAAAVTAGVLVVGNLTAPMTGGGIEAIPTVAPKPSAEPSPEPTVEPLTVQSVLSGAANTTASYPAPVAGPGQYLMIDHQSQQLVLYAPGDLNPSRAEATAGWTVTSSYTTYIPANRSDEWVEVFRPDRQIVDLFGEEAGVQSQAWLEQFSGMTDPIIRRYEGGLPNVTDVPFGSDAHYAQLPRDPAALIDWIRDYSGATAGPDSDAMVVGFLIQELQLNAAPADLRPAMYQALSMMPNGVVLGTVGNVVTLSFPTYAANERWDSISIDTSTALVTSSSFTLGSGGTIVPDGVPNHLVSQTVTVVDDAP